MPNILCAIITLLLCSGLHCAESDRIIESILIKRGNFGSMKSAISVKANNVYIESWGVQGEPDDVRMENAKRDAVKAALIILAKTETINFSITCMPLIVKPSNDLDDPVIRIGTIPSMKHYLNINRETATEVIRNLTGLDDPAQLYESQVVDGILYEDFVTATYQRMIYNDQGYPTLDLVWSRLKSN